MCYTRRGLLYPPQTMKKAKVTTSEQKLKELIIYISRKCSEDMKYSKTKLNKILFYSDFFYYLRTQKAITGHKYIHLQFGPVPHNIDVLLKTMTSKDIAIAYVQEGLYTKNKIVPLRDPDLNFFEPEMISLVDSVINQVCGEESLTATQLSESSHKTIAWRVTSTGNEIPYQTAYLKDVREQTATQEEREKARFIAKALAGSYGFPTNI